MKNFLQNRWLILMLRLILGVMFVAASIAKIQDIDKFISTVASYGLLPDILAHIYGYVIPWLELSIGFALVLGIFVRFSAALLLPLAISFIVASSYAVVNVTDGSCGCFGTFFTLSHQGALIIDVLILFSTLILLFNRGKEFISIGRLIDRENIKSRNFHIGFRLGVVVLAVVVTGSISIGIHNLSKPTEGIVEIVSISAPLSNDVDISLLKDSPILLEFYADDCDACEKAEPIIIELEKQYAGKITFIRVDYYQSAQAVADMSVKSTPTIFVIVSKNTEGKYNVLGRFEDIIESEVLQASLEKAVQNR